MADPKKKASTKKISTPKNPGVLPVNINPTEALAKLFGQMLNNPAQYMPPPQQQQPSYHDVRFGPAPKEYRLPADAGYLYPLPAPPSQFQGYDDRYTDGWSPEMKSVWMGDPLDQGFRMYEQTMPIPGNVNPGSLTPEQLYVYRESGQIVDPRTAIEQTRMSRLVEQLGGVR